MTNDSVTVALMRTLGVTDVATADADFNNVSNIRVYQPGDIPEKERCKVTADWHRIVVPLKIS
jgi:hypothetical protein